MSSYKTLSVIGVIAVFLASAAAGYFVPVDLRALLGMETEEETVAEVYEEQDIPESPAAEPEMVIKEDVVEEPVIEQTGVPVIRKVTLTPCTEFGYRVSVEASAPDGNPLNYELREIGAEVSKYNFIAKIGYVSTGVAPTPTGKYELIVTNKVTGAAASQIVEGFDFVQKMSASTLESHLNSYNPPADFYKYLADAQNQRIMVENLPEDYDNLKDVTSLSTARVANGWTYQVISESLKYDSYNRIYQFTIKIIE